MARHPLPTKIKALQGTLRKDRQPKNEPEADLHSLPEPPKTLDAVGRQAFTRTCAKLLELGMLTNAGIPQIERYSFAYQLWIDATSHLKASKIAKDMPTGKNWFFILKESEKSMLAFEDRWGLSPMSQNKVQWPDRQEKQEQEDEFDII